MADIPVKIYRTTTVREGTSPTNPSFPADQDPIIENPEGTSDFVPYVDANKDVNLGEFGLSTGFVKYDTTPTNIPEDQGTSYWDVDDETVAIVMNGITQKVGEDQFLPVKNMTGATIPKGRAVGYAGTIGSSGRVLISLFLANGANPSKLFLGVTGESIPTGGDSKVYTFGRLKGINTSAFTANQVLYCSPSVAGGFTATVPTSPSNIISVAVVINSSATVGSIFIRPQIGSDINEDEGVRIISPTNGQALVYDSVLGLWVNGGTKHNLTTDKQGGDGTNFYHLGENDYDDIKNIIEPEQAGINWIIRTSSSNNNWGSITYGDGLFVAVSFSGTGNRVMTSPDGITWTSRTSAADNQWFSITYGNGLFVAVSATGTGNRVMTSPDGITWTVRTSAADNDWSDIIYGDGLFVAVSFNGVGNRVMTSPDGITWTIRTSAANNSWYGVTYGDGLFVAVSASGVNNRVMTSPDGITWTIRTSAADNQWGSITYGNGLFVAVSASGTGDRVMTSPDGINWTIRTSAADNDWQSVTYGDGLFVAVSSTGTGDKVMTSPDGITWTSRTSAADNFWLGITYGDGLFVAVSASGVNNRVMTSGLNKILKHSSLILDDGRNPHETRYEDLIGTPNIGLNQIVYGTDTGDIDGNDSLTYDNSTKVMNLEGTSIANIFRSTQQTITLAIGATFDPVIPAGTSNIMSIIATNENITYLIAIVTRLSAGNSSLNTIQSNNIAGSLFLGEIRITNNSGQSLNLVVNLLCLNKL